MKKQHKVVLGLLVTVIISFVLIMLKSSHDQKTILPMTIQVGDHLGFNVDGSGIDFGTAMPGNTVERTIMLTGEQGSYVALRVKNMEFVTASESAFIIQAGTKKYISLYAAIPVGMEKGIYTGSLEIISKII